MKNKGFFYVIFKAKLNDKDGDGRMVIVARTLVALLLVVFVVILAMIFIHP